MEYLHRDLPVEGFSRPAGLVTAVVDAASGKLPTDHSGHRVQELFIEGRCPPKGRHPYPFQIAKSTGKLARPRP